MSITYEEFLEVFHDAIVTLKALYRLKAKTQDEITRIYKEIKRNLIKMKVFTPSQILSAISCAAIYNNRFLRSYWALFKIIYNKYQPKTLDNLTPLFNELFRLEYELQNKSDISTLLEFHEENTIFRAIMDDDIQAFIAFTEREGFDENQYNRFRKYYPYSRMGLTLLEFCCYHGAVKCFKFLRTKYNFIISYKCVLFSFLSGNPDILNECLKYQPPHYNLGMEFAIISHNIDFVMFIQNHYNYEIDLYSCKMYNNIQVFFIYLIQHEDFSIKPLCFLFHKI